MVTWHFLDDFPEGGVHGCQGDGGPQLEAGLDTLDSGQLGDVSGSHQHRVQLPLELDLQAWPPSGRKGGINQYSCLLSLTCRPARRQAGRGEGRKESINE